MLILQINQKKLLKLGCKRPTQTVRMRSKMANKSIELRSLGRFDHLKIQNQKIVYMLKRLNQSINGQNLKTQKQVKVRKSQKELHCLSL